VWGSASASWRWSRPSNGCCCIHGPGLLPRRGLRKGCWERRPLSGVLCACVALILLTVPVIAGLATARVLTGRRWQIAVAAVAAGVMLAGFVLAALSFGVISSLR
jgi:uncharacterized membrane protein